MMAAEEQLVKKENRKDGLRHRAQSAALAVRGIISNDSANPRRIGPSTDAGTVFSGATAKFADLRGNSMRLSSFMPTSRRNSAEKPMSSARSTPQNHSFSSWRCRKSSDSSSFFMARSNEDARKNTPSDQACRG